MNFLRKQDIIPIIFLIFSIIIAIFFLKVALTDGGKCVSSPLRYYEEKSNYSLICGCYNSNGPFWSRPLSYNDLINVTNLRP